MEEKSLDFSNSGKKKEIFGEKETHRNSERRVALGRKPRIGDYFS